MLIYEELIPNNRTAFVKKVREISARLDIDPNWLMAVMKKESALKPTAINHFSGAVGLIQFLPSTLNSNFNGMTPETMRAMSNLEQLQYVELYLKPYKNRMTSYTDTYLSVFYPAAIGKDDNYVFPQRVYTGNANMDMDKDGKITIKDVRNWLMAGIPAEKKKYLTKGAAYCKNS